MGKRQCNYPVWKKVVRIRSGRQYRAYSKAQLDTFCVVGKARCELGILFCVVDFFGD